MNWSDYQLAVFDAVENTDRHIVVQATAGSGKSTSLVAIANRIKSGLRCRFLAFNKIIAEELSEKLPEHFPASTIHSYGFSKLNKTGYKFKVDGYKLHRIIGSVANMLHNYFDDEQEKQQFEEDLRDLINMTRLCRVDYNDVRAMIDMSIERGLVGYDPQCTFLYEAIFEVIEWTAKPSRKVYELTSTGNNIVNQLNHMGHQGRSAIPDKCWIDFTDMIELPLKWELVDKENDLILFDEAQDSSYLNFSFIKESLSETGRLISVGDSKQNIFGFAGSFLDGMATIVREMNAIELPLSVSYRMPKSHVELANTVFAGTEPASWAEDGVIEYLDNEQLIDVVQELYKKDESILIMCRRNAPTVRFATKLLKMRVPAKIRGRDFCNGIKSVIKQACYSGKTLRKDFSFDKFDDFLGQWYGKERKRLVAKQAGEVAFESLSDKYESISILYSTSDATTLDEFTNEIDALFTDNGDKIQLSSIHRAKGLECPVTALLEYHKLPMTWKDQTPAQRHAEQCVWFVGVTRSKGTMYLVDEED